jgi:hypothetical protein
MSDKPLKTKLKGEIISRLDELPEYDLFIVLGLIEDIRKVRRSVKV